MLEQFGAFIKDAMSKGMAENDATRKAQMLSWGIQRLLRASVAFFLWQAFIRFGALLPQWPGFAQTLLEDVCLFYGTSQRLGFGN